MYKVPRVRSQLEPKTRPNIQARNDAVEYAIMHLERALKELAKAPAMDFSGDLVYFSQDIQDILDSDGGEAGLKNLLKTYQKELADF